jgi:Trk K+ transport system NAD-binding subunit
MSVLVFTFGMKEDTWIDAFFRTISLMATGADMHGEEVDRGSWQKLYISGLRLIGVALTAAFTAIFTNYLIRANLSSALEVRRIPESGHIIVCGLGNVGFRVVEELRALGELVVVIEQDAGNPFIPSARRLGAAVILGNAVVPEVLRQAHAETARAVAAATSNELLNLEIALLVRELKPGQRILVRLSDPQLAQTLREAAQVRLALSIPELAAPAFVASLYGNEVRSLFQIDGVVLAVCELTVQRQHSATLRELAHHTGFIPVHRADAEGKEALIQMDAIPTTRDRFIGIIPVANMERLFQGQPDPTSDLAAKPPGMPNDNPLARTLIVYDEPKRGPGVTP